MADCPDDWPQWWFTWWLLRRLPWNYPPRADPPPGPDPTTGGPSVPPAEMVADVEGLTQGEARRAVGTAAELAAALPQRPTGSWPLDGVDQTISFEGVVQPRGSRSLASPPVPTTPPVLADQPTFLGKGEPNQPDLIGNRAIRPSGAAFCYPQGGVDDGGSCFIASTAGAFYVDTSDGWASTAQVSVEAWLQPSVVSAGKTQVLLDARSYHVDYGSAWQLNLAALLSELLRGCLDWRGLAAFLHRLRWLEWLALQQPRQEWLGWQIRAEGADVVASFGTGGSEGTVRATNVLHPYQWTYVVATCDGSIRKLYINGSIAATATYSGYLPPIPGVAFTLGRGAINAAAIDEVSIYDYPLTADRVSAHYTGLGTAYTSYGVLDNLVALPLRPLATNTLAPVVELTSGLSLLPPIASLPITPAVTRDIGLPLGDFITDAALAEAIASPLRRPIFTMRADWNRNGLFDHPLSDLTDLVTDVKVTRELAGDLPAEVGLVEGHSAASMSVTLEGQWDTDIDTGITGGPNTSVDAVYAFAPYHPDAPLYGFPTISTPIEFELGFLTKEGRAVRRRFTGSVSQLSPSSAERRVTLEALDQANQMRAPIVQPPIGLDGLLLAEFGPGQYFPRINSQWLVDRIFRANGIYASPPSRHDAILSATCHGSMIPEIGGGGVPQEIAISAVKAQQTLGPTGSPNTSKIRGTPRAWAGDDGKGDHPWNMMYPHPDGPPMTGTWYANEQVTMGAGDGIGFSCWARMPSTYSDHFLFVLFMSQIANTANAHFVTVQIIGGYPVMTVRTPTNGHLPFGYTSAQYTVPLKPTWTFLGCHWEFQEGAVLVTLNIGGVIYQQTHSLTVTTGLWAPNVRVLYSLDLPITNVQMWHRPKAPFTGDDGSGGTDPDVDDASTSEESGWVGASWISEADIDPGLNELYGIPDIQGEDSWQLLTELVAAEHGSVGFSETNRPYFHSRAIKRERGTPSLVTSDRDLANMATITDEASVRNSITSGTAPLIVGDWEWILKSTDRNQFQSAPGTTSFDITLPPDTVIAEPSYLLYSYYEYAEYAAEAFRQSVEYPPFRNALIFSAIPVQNPFAYIAFDAVNFGFFRRTPSILTMVVYNFTGYTIIFSTPSRTDQTTGEVTEGEPALYMPGRKLVTQSSTTQVISDPGSISRYGERTYDLGGQNDRWYQHPRATAGIAEGVLASTAHPAPVLDTVTVTHDPRRHLADPITVLDPAGLGEVTGSTVGITTGLSATSAAVDELAIRPIAPPGFGVLGDPQYGRIGQTLRFGA